MAETTTTPARRVRMRVSELRPSERNPRTISSERLENLKRSLTQDRNFLEARPLLVNSYPGRENVVIAGNMRLRAARELGWREVPVLVVAVPPEVEAQWTLKDNNRWGEYVEEDLAQILAELAARGVETDLLGFAPDALERLLGLASASTPGDGCRLRPDAADAAAEPAGRPAAPGAASPGLRRQPRGRDLAAAHGAGRAGRRDVDRSAVRRRPAGAIRGAPHGPGQGKAHQRRAGLRR